MFAGVRRFCFSFVGGYAMTDLYIRSASVRIQDRLDDLAHLENRHQQTEAKKSSWWGVGGGSKGMPVERDNTLREDIDQTISESQVASLVVLSLVLLGGGPAGCVGAMAAVAFDGPDGNERYWDMRDRIDEFLHK